MAAAFGIFAATLYWADLQTRNLFQGGGAFFRPGGKNLGALFRGDKKTKEFFA
jgi:hypothetical protein